MTWLYRSLQSRQNNYYLKQITTVRQQLQSRLPSHEENSMAPMGKESPSSGHDTAGALNYHSQKLFNGDTWVNKTVKLPKNLTDWVGPQGEGLFKNKF